MGSEAKILQKIEEGQIGFEKAVPGPFGYRKIVYTDYTASGRALKFIEDYIQHEVLPFYANTHTGTSHTSRQTTHFREEARDIIRRAVNGSADDVVIFTGNGCTGVVHKLIHAMHLRSLPTPPVIFVGPFEHHSNLLPWRELGAEVVWIEQTSRGTVDLADLEQKLKLYRSKERCLVGSFSAASNLTGVLTDTEAIASLLHQYGAKSLWDYASAAPYVEIDMNPTSIHGDLAYKDAIFFSMHKFIGGVGAPGILVAKKHLFTNNVPDQCGGGTVFFVTASKHEYLKGIEEREEGGTPNIVGSIRAGLAMQLKQSVGTDTIMKIEDAYCQFVYSQWRKVPGLVVCGPQPHVTRRLPIFSICIYYSPLGRYLNHNFVCTLLADLFGIQARGGCACAGPYAQDLLGIDQDLAHRYEELDRKLSQHVRIQEVTNSDKEVLRPGMTRLSFPFFMSKDTVAYVVKAVTMIAMHGWKLLSMYKFNPVTGSFYHPQHNVESDRIWLTSSVNYIDGIPSHQTSNDREAPSYKDVLEEVDKMLTSASIDELVNSKTDDDAIFLTEEAERLRWFLLPSDVQKMLLGAKSTTQTVPFVPVAYNNDIDDDDVIMTS